MRRVWERIAFVAGSNMGLRFLAVAMAVGLWLAGQKDIERAVEVPVEFRNVPADLMVTDNRVDYIVLRLVGPRTLVSTPGPENLKLRLDLDDARPGPSSFPLGPGSFHLPRGVKIARISPSVIHLRLEPVAKKSLPVAIRFSGKPLFGYKVSRAAVEPEQVIVHGPAHEVKRITSAETITVELDGIQGGFSREVRLAAEGRPISFSPARVTVSVELEEERMTREFGRIEVRSREFTGEYTVTPRTVYLRLSGPKRILQPFEVDSNEVFLELKGLPSGDHTLPLSFNLPQEVKVLDQRPERFKVKIIKPQT